MSTSKSQKTTLIYLHVTSNHHNNYNNSLFSCKVYFTSLGTSSVDIKYICTCTIDNRMRSGEYMCSYLVTLLCYVDQAWWFAWLDAQCQATSCAWRLLCSPNSSAHRSEGGRQADYHGTNGDRKGTHFSEYAASFQSWVCLHLFTGATAIHSNEWGPSVVIK